MPSRERKGKFGRRDHELWINCWLLRLLLLFLSEQLRLLLFDHNNCVCDDMWMCVNSTLFDCLPSSRISVLCILQLPACDCMAQDSSLNHNTVHYYYDCSMNVYYYYYYYDFDDLENRRTKPKCCGEAHFTIRINTFGGVGKENRFIPFIAMCYAWIFYINIFSLSLSLTQRNSFRRYCSMRLNGNKQKSYSSAPQTLTNIQPREKQK